MKRNLNCIALALVLGSGLPAANAAVTGQWDFNSSNLVMTIGTDLAYFGDAEAATTFETMPIKGVNAVVMHFPKTTPGQGYTMTHGIAPNGGGAYVNQYTLIMDIMYPASSSGLWRSLFQTSTGNANDGDFFVNDGNGIGIASTYSGTLNPDTWHRVAFVVDLTQPTERLRKYIDGTLVGVQNLDGGVDGRFSLDPTALLFADQDNETEQGYVNSVQIHDVALSTSDIFALAGPTAAGIPTTIPVLTEVSVTAAPTNRENVAGISGNFFTASGVGSGTLTYQWYRNGAPVSGQTNTVLRFTSLQLADAGDYTVVAGNGLQSATSSPPVTLTVVTPNADKIMGQWDFNSGDLRATVGQPLQYGTTGPATLPNEVQFNSTTLFGVADIGGQPANVALLNPSTAATAAWGGLLMNHGISPNGGGTNVNQYTIIIDLLYPSWSSGFYRALLQTDLGNTNDAEVFINGNNGLGISSTYQGSLTLDEWHRVVLAFDLTKREFGKYIDGTNVLTNAVGSAPLGASDAQYVSGGVDSRWSLPPAALLFADEDGEVQPVYVSSIQIRSGRMTDAAIAVMGAPTSAKIPGAIKAVKSGSSISIEWVGTELQSATSIGGPWSVVEGAAHPYPVPTPSGSRFFKVLK